ncbi:ATP-binding protein [Streptomyces sp. NPDC085614]|uniref:ATP-binding protein n=1 Tax=Streptomyces sp. NPDC085614 TaxID=3365733 RepID=UPI0037D01505
MPGPRRPADGGSWPLQHRPEAASAARRIARRMLEDWHVSGDIEDTALLVVSELVTNAVEHAQAPVVLHLHHQHADGRVWVGVTDGGPAPHDGAWSTSCTPDEHGRGLDLIDALTTAHGTHTHTHGGTTHWARLHTT